MSTAPGHEPGLHGHQPPGNIWTHCADIFDRTLDNDDRTRRLHGFTDPLLGVGSVVLVLVLLAFLGIVVVLAVGGLGMLLFGLTVCTAPAWTPFAGGAGLGAATLAGFGARRGVRTLWNRMRATRSSPGQPSAA